MSYLRDKLLALLMYWYKQYNTRAFLHKVQESLNCLHRERTITQTYLGDTIRQCIKHPVSEVICQHLQAVSVFNLQFSV